MHACKSEVIVLKRKERMRVCMQAKAGAEWPRKEVAAKNRELGYCEEFPVCTERERERGRVLCSAMRRLLSRSSRGTARRRLDYEAPLESASDGGVVELQKRRWLKKILKLMLLAVVFCLPCLWWIGLFISIKPHTSESAVFPLHARFEFFDNPASNVSRDSPGLKILSWNNVLQSESYYRGVRPLHNIAFFAEIYVRDKTYFMLIDTGSEVSWLFCEPPFVISKDNPKLAHIDMSTTSGKLVFGCELFLQTKKSLAGSIRCGHSSTGPVDDIKNGVDGILGLMPAKFSFPHQLAMAGAIRKVIGLCLEKYFHHPPQQVVGYLSLGDEVISVPEEMTWIQMVDDAIAFGFAAAFLKTIQIGAFIYQFGPEGQSQKNAKIVFDTGTTATYLVPDVYYGLIQHLDRHAAYIGYKPLHGDVLRNSGHTVKRLVENYKMCWYRDLNNTSVMWYNDFENVILTFQDVIGGNGVAKFQIEPLQYLNIYQGADIESKRTIICSLFLKHENVNSQSFSILGGMAFQGHLIVFDMDNNQIGWSIEEDCELLKFQKKILEMRTSQ